MGHDGRDDADGTAQDQARTRDLSSRRAPFVVAGRAEKVLQIVIRVGEIGHVVAGKETRSVARGDFEEVIDGRGERTKGLPLLGDRFQEPVVGCTDSGAILLRVIGQEVGCLMENGIGRTNLGEGGSRGLEAVGYQPVEAGEVVRQPLFSATR